MKRILLVLAGALLAVSSAFAEQKMTCSLTVSPKGGESKVTKTGTSGLIGRSVSNLSNTGSKTIQRSLKWLAEVRFRNLKPEKLELKAYYIGYGDGGKTLKQLSNETHKLELDKDGRASVELDSPMTRLTKTRSRTTSSSRSGGFSSIKKTTSGERVTGCVVQVFADGQMVKSWSSDSRWTAAAGKTPFSVAELAAKSGRIGVK